MNTPANTSDASVRLLILAVGFACTITLLRMVTFGTVGDETAAGMGLVAFVTESPYANTILALARTILLAVLALAAWFRRGSLTRPILLATALIFIVSVALLSLVSNTVVVHAAAIGIGFASAMVMYVWMMLLASHPTSQIVRAALLGLLISIVCIGLTQAAPLSLRPAIAALLVGVSLAIPVACDPTLAFGEADGPITRAQIAQIPWMPLLVFLVCGILSSVLYGTADYTAGLYDTTANMAAFGISAALGVFLTATIMLQGPSWPSAMWAPLFVMFLLADAFASLATHAAFSASLGLLLGCVFSFHFLRFVVFPALISELELPRAALSSVFLLLTNSFLATQAGRAIVGIAPVGLQGMSRIAGMIAVVALGVLGLMVLLYVMRRPVRLGATVEDDAADTVSPEEALAQRFEQLTSTYELTQREEEVAQLTAQGFNASYISERLAISQSTVRFHQQNVYRKIGIHSRAELIELVNASGVVDE